MADQDLRKVKRSVACRECQRLKLKCNKSWPCESCVKRGVSDLCPEGVLPTAKRQRSNLIDTSRLYERNMQMGARIRQLEDALAAMQSNVSTNTHPLLNESLLSLGAPLERMPIIEGIRANIGATNAVEETIEAFGTLSIGADGRTVFHSQAVSADYLVEPPWNTHMRDRSIAEAMSLPPEIIGLGTLFPFGDTKMPLGDLKLQIMSFLPSSERVRELTDNYFEHFSWWFDPLPREQFEQEIYPILDTPVGLVPADRLSVLFIILGIGVILDLDVPLDLTSADSYWQLSRATFCLEPLLDVSTIYTIQALQLMNAYFHITNRQKVEQQWVLLGLVARLIHSSGLHFDAAHWIKKDARTVERRRKVFNEALVYDALMSFNMGRPPSFALAHVQCKLPADAEIFIGEDGLEQCGFANWKYRFTKECLFPVMDEAFGARPPSYSTILRLDRKIREFPVPRHLIYTGLSGSPEDSDADQVPLRKWLQRAFVFFLRETSLINLHRSHYAQALMQHPANPFEGTYSASVLAIFRSASRIIAGCRDISSRSMTLVSRVWWMWQNLFSAGVVLANLVSRSPRCKLAHAALVELNHASELLLHRTQACRSADSRRLMARLLCNAEESYESGKPTLMGCGLGVLDDDELVIFTAASRIISREAYQSLIDLPVLPVEEEQPGPMAISWQDGHPDLMQIFNQVETATGLDPAPGPLVSGSDSTVFESWDENEAQWQRIMQEISS